MKRMNEVFELPVSGIEMQDHVAFRTFADEDDAIAHAINNVDALADALEHVISAWKFLCMCNGYDEDHLVEFENAKKVLAAYRGTK